MIENQVCSIRILKKKYILYKREENYNENLNNTKTRADL